MNNLLIRSLAIGIGSIFSFILVAFTVISLSLPGILNDWERNNNRVLIQTITERLSGLSPDTNNDLPNRIRAALLDLPARAEYVAVLDSQAVPVYLNRMGNSGGLGINMLRKIQESEGWHIITLNGQPWLRFAAQALPFDADQSNRLLFSAIQLSAIWASIIASLIAFLMAFLISRPLSLKARHLAQTLKAMQGGQRDLVLPRGGVRELGEIAQCAQDLQDGLRKEEATRRQWAADIAHDLRTPLTVLKGQFEGMLDGIFQPDRKRLERNYQEIQYLERLILQLSELTKLETPGFRPQFQECDPLTILRTLAERFRDTAAVYGSRIEVLGGPCPSFPVLADPSLLDRLLSNLIDNGLRHGQAAASLLLSLGDAPAGTIRFVVDNAGVIPGEILPRLFDRLFRADTSRDSAGSGLGLAIAKAIAEVHGGSLSVDCDSSSGRTRFSLILPILP